MTRNAEDFLPTLPMSQRPNQPSPNRNRERIILKCHYNQILDIHLFYIFVHIKSFLKILPNFNLLRTLELMFFGTLSPRIYFLSVQVLIKNFSKLRHFLKNTTRVEITIKVTTAILIKYYKNLCSHISVICYINCHYNFNLCVYFWRHLLKFSTKTWNKEY